MGRAVEDDEAAIRRLIDDLHRAVWAKDFEAFAKCHVQADYARRWAWLAAGNAGRQGGVGGDRRAHPSGDGRSAYAGRRRRDRAAREFQPAHRGRHGLADLRPAGADNRELEPGGRRVLARNAGAREARRRVEGRLLRRHQSQPAAARRPALPPRRRGASAMEERSRGEGTGGGHRPHPARRTSPGARPRDQPRAAGGDPLGRDAQPRLRRRARGGADPARAGLRRTRADLVGHRRCRGHRGHGERPAAAGRKAGACRGGLRSVAGAGAAGQGHRGGAGAAGGGRGRGHQPQHGAHASQAAVRQDRRAQSPTSRRSRR